MRDLQHSLPPEQDNENSNGLIAFMFLGIFLVGLMTSITFTKNYFDMTKLEKDGALTQAVIVEKIRQPNGKSRTRYYIKYKFDNKYATETCLPIRKFKTTPKYKACKKTLQVQPTTKTEYNKISARQTVNVLYLRSDKKTRSLITGLTYNKTNSLVGIGLSVLAMIASILVLLAVLIRSVSKKS